MKISAFEKEDKDALVNDLAKLNFFRWNHELLSKNPARVAPCTLGMLPFCLPSIGGWK